MVDPFDLLLISTCDIYQRTAATNDYGHSTGVLEVLESGVACRLSTLSAPKEFKVDKQAAVSNKKVFMRPVSLGDDDAPLGAHHVLKIDDVFYNILGPPLDPSNLHHHLEVFVEEVSA